MKWSLGRGRYGQVAETIDTCWQEFTTFLRDCQHLQRLPAQKDDHWWIAPFMLHQGANHRTIDDVDHMANWIGFDVDYDNLSVNDLRVRLDGRWLAYTTASSVPGDSRWRIVVGLSRVYTKAEHARLFQWYTHKLPLDVKTRNCNRIFYLPAQWDNADNLWWSQDGRPTDVDSILTMVPEPIVTPPPSSPPQAGTRAAPAGTEIVTPRMLAAAQAAPAGGRLYRLMCQSAKRYRLEGWQLDASDLAYAGMLASAQFSPGKARPNILRESLRAIDWANSHCTPLTPLERMRQRILWERRPREY